MSAAVKIRETMRKVAASSFKGPYIDLDPLNVYFWLLAGMVAGLYRCERGARAGAGGER